MKRLTDKQIQHQINGRNRIREAVQNAKQDLNLPFETFTGTAFIALNIKQPFVWCLKWRKNSISFIPHGIEIHNSIDHVFQLSPHCTII